MTTNPLLAPLVFLDTESTGLGYGAEVWEFFGIRREPDGTEDSLHLFIEHDKNKCATLPEPFQSDHQVRYPAHGRGALTKPNAARAIWQFLEPTDGVRAHLVGAVPAADAEWLGDLLRSNGFTIPWHHHLIDVEPLMIGWLAAQGTLVDAPWTSDDLSQAIGVKAPTDQRHTAEGDAQWVRAIYDRIMSPAGYRVAPPEQP